MQNVILETVLKELKDHGIDYTIEHRTKHNVIKWNGGSHIVPRQHPTSDPRAHLNARAEIRRKLMTATSPVQTQSNYNYPDVTGKLREINLRIDALAMTVKEDRDAISWIKNEIAVLHSIVANPAPDYANKIREIINQLWGEIDVLKAAVTNLSAPKAPQSKHGITVKAMLSKLGIVGNQDIGSMLKLYARQYAKEHGETVAMTGGTGKKYEYFSEAAANYAMDQVTKSGLK